MEENEVPMGYST